MKVEVYHLVADETCSAVVQTEQLDLRERITWESDRAAIAAVWRGLDKQLWYHHVAVLEIKGNDELEVAEEAWRVTNHIDESWNLNPEVLSCDVTARSSNVGDVFVLYTEDGIKTYFAATCGFGLLY